jgi:hypothetical protein
MAPVLDPTVAAAGTTSSGLQSAPECHVKYLDMADVVRDVEKLLCPKFAKIKLCWDALQTTFLIF